MGNGINSFNVRKGRFLWMETKDRELFIKELKNKIETGYYYSDAISNRIADDLTPVMVDTIDDG